MVFKERKRESEREGLGGPHIYTTMVQGRLPTPVMGPRGHVEPHQRHQTAKNLLVLDCVNPALGEDRVDGPDGIWTAAQGMTSKGMARVEVVGEEIVVPRVQDCVAFWAAAIAAAAASALPAVNPTSNPSQSPHNAMPLFLSVGIRCAACRRSGSSRQATTEAERFAIFASDHRLGP